MSEKMKTYKAHPMSFVFMLLSVIAIAITVLVFIMIVGYILVRGIPHLSPRLFEWEYNSENVSMLPSIITTFEMVLISMIIAAPIGVFCAIYLVEYAKRGNKAVKLIRLTTETLSGIPSIIYGLFGNMFFVFALHWGRSVLAGACTLAIMVLPLIIRSTEEALKSVDDSYREASFGLGAGKLRTIFVIILPSAMSGILSGIILAIGRIVGETAALVFTSGTVAKVGGLFSSQSTLAVHMYTLSSEGIYMDEAAATAVVLMVAVLLLNALATWVAKKFSKGDK
ncbi:MAG: phosphate ABC transporter permease PstA [Ruminococcus sp.]|nr:phosphate ABC transporter permease PstA [Ruminococcus sp.]